MTSNLKLIYPTIDLFLYDLREGLGDSAEDINQKRLKFWQRLNPQLTEDGLEPYQKLDPIGSSFSELLPSKYQPFQEVNGYFYPVQLNDTFALLVDVSGNPQGSKQAYPIVDLKETRDIILEKRTPRKGNIGETWLIWGQLPHEEQDKEATFKECYQVFLSDERKQGSQTYQGQFLGADLWEIWQPSTELDSPDYAHLIIALFPPQATITSDKINSFYQQFLYLFSYRHKIHWIYTQSRGTKQDLNRAARDIQGKVNSLPKQVLQTHLNLEILQKQLTETLTIFSVYASALSTLEEYKHALNVNIENYQKRLKTLKERDKSSNLSLFEPFLNYAQEKYLPQLTTDYNSASASLKLLENMTKTLEGIIQLEQAKRDRTLNQTIFIVSTGIGAASASASSIANVAEDLIVQRFPLERPEGQPLPPGYLWGIYSFAFVLSLILGLGCSGLMGFLFWLGKRR
ncbi:hypothetical protein [Spirulina subsalsa]|uniref:hypothetical protein n=1 Tax=Spirulina subsalsa TaxID=54311 RepID=UPI000317BF2A|nr:hypothetical protein [Spirulina subsalsa]